jgi:predicted DNA-binding transcriptional regulator YafY
MLNQVKILRVLQLISMLQQRPSKSIKQLSSMLNNTERTVYRYLDLIKALGFDLQRDSNFRFYIASDNSDSINLFTAAESELVKELLLTASGNNALKDSILRKVYLKSEVSMQGEHLLNAFMGKMIEDLSFAIENDKQAILKNYHSVSNSMVVDKVVEPIKFTENYSMLCAYDIDTSENVFFKIERFSDVEVLETSSQFKSKHRFEKLDAFGSPPSSVNPVFKVELLLSLRAYILLKEEYPGTLQFIKKTRNSYILSTSVNEAKPVIRFVMGLLDEIEILGSDEFQEYVLEYVKKLLTA